MGNIRTLAALSFIAFALSIILVISISLATAADRPRHAFQRVCAFSADALPYENFNNLLISQEERKP